MGGGDEDRREVLGGRMTARLTTEDIAVLLVCMDELYVWRSKRDWKDDRERRAYEHLSKMLRDREVQRILRGEK